MTCPRCHTADLDEKDRRGVKIDICPSCRGVWLDRGELEKLIAMSVADNADDPQPVASPARAHRRPDSDDEGRRRKRDDDDDDDDDDDHRHRRKRGSIWDFFD